MATPMYEAKTRDSIRRLASFQPTAGSIIVYCLECTKTDLRILGEHAPRPSFGHALPARARTRAKFVCYDVLSISTVVREF